MSKFPVKPILAVNRNNITDNRQVSVIDSFINENDVFDVSNRNIDSLYNFTKEAIDKRKPMFLWSKKRNNEKIKLDNQHQHFLLDKILTLRDISDGYNRLYADEIFTEELIRNIVANKRMEAKHYFELAVANHKLSLTKIISEIDLLNSSLEDKEIENDRKRAETEKIRVENESMRADNLLKYAQVDRIRAETESIASLNELKRLLTERIDFSQYPPVLITYLLASLSGVQTDSFANLDIQEELKDIVVGVEKEKLRKLEIETNDFKNSAEFREWQFRRDRMAIEKRDRQ
jgi:hypothetical protein